MRCAGILLTGGSSTRMGRDKATLAIDDSGLTLAQRAADALAAVADPVLEVGRGATSLRACREEPPGGGPLVALHAGLGALDAIGPRRPAVLVLACDLPGVEPGLLRWLADHPAPGSVVPLAGSPPTPQPLCARWSAGALARVAALVADGRRAIGALLDGDDVVLVDQAEWEAVAGSPVALDDADTPADVARLLPGAGTAP